SARTRACSGSPRVVRSPASSTRSASPRRPAKAERRSARRVSSAWTSPAAATRMRFRAGAIEGPIPVSCRSIPTAYRWPPVTTDFEAEGLLEGLTGEAREARCSLLEELEAAGVPLDELRSAVADGRLALLPLERELTPPG